MTLATLNWEQGQLLLGKDDLGYVVRMVDHDGATKGLRRFQVKAKAVEQFAGTAKAIKDWRERNVPQEIERNGPQA